MFHYVCLPGAQLCLVIFAEKEFIETHLETQMNSATLPTVCFTPVIALVIMQMDEILGESVQLQSESDRQNQCSHNCERDIF